MKYYFRLWYQRTELFIRNRAYRRRVLHGLHS